MTLFWYQRSQWILFPNTPAIRRDAKWNRDTIDSEGHEGMTKRCKGDWQSCLTPKIYDFALWTKHVSRPSRLGKWENIPVSERRSVWRFENGECGGSSTDPYSFSYRLSTAPLPPLFSRPLTPKIYELGPLPADADKVSQSHTLTMSSIISNINWRHT